MITCARCCLPMTPSASGLPEAAPIAVWKGSECIVVIAITF